MNIYEKLFEIQKRDLVIKRTADNPYYKSKYAPYEEVRKIVDPVMKEIKLLEHSYVDN